MIKNFVLYVELLKWIFLRLPMAFSIPFAVLTYYWVGKWNILAMNYFNQENITGNIKNYLQVIPPLFTVADGAIAILVFLAGIIVVYNVSVLINLIYYKTRKYHVYLVLNRFKRLHNKEWFKALAQEYTFEREIDKYKDVPPVSNKKFNKNLPRIGIILAGGGAKGAYQAGAMAAIYKYLQDLGMLSQVRMIAGTSIGSWNSLFWVAGLLQPNPNKGNKSFHQIWWEYINIKSTIMPWFYIPFVHNAFLSTKPWQDQFERIFNNKKGDKGEIRDRLLNAEIHFYLTKTNVGSGLLEFVTNRPKENQEEDKIGIPNLRLNAKNPGEEQPEEEVAIPSDRFERLNKDDEESFFSVLKNGLFASMNLPPLFAYSKGIGGGQRKLFEDGGVISNLPAYFGIGAEICDLLFILPLNADFENPEVNTSSMIMRLMRVIDVRQGALEREALHSIRIYNELAEARVAAWGWQKINGSEGGYWQDSYWDQEYWESWDWRDWGWKNFDWNEISNKKDGTKDPDWAENVEAPLNPEVEETHKGGTKRHNERKKLHNPISVFAVCPDGELAISTAEFWKSKQAMQAFNLLYSKVEDKLYDTEPLIKEKGRIAVNKKLAKEIKLHKISPTGLIDEENISKSAL